MLDRWRVKHSALLLLGVLFVGGCASINPRTIEDAIFQTGPLDEGTVVAGLREALTVGTGRSVDVTSAVDGFLGNALIRIALK